MILKSLDLDDFMDFSEEAMIAVVTWTKSYGVNNATLISQVEPNEDNFGAVLEVWGIPFFIRYCRDGNIVSVVDVEYDLIKLAEFDYDDFPWDKLPTNKEQ